MILRRLHPDQAGRQRYQTTNELRAVVTPLVNRTEQDRPGQRPDMPERLFFEALPYMGRTGIP